MSLRGECLCGAISFELMTPPTEVEACHCDTCRTWTGGAPFFGVAVMGRDIRWQGEDMIALYASSEWAERGFCSRCGTNLFYRMRGTAATGNYSLCPGLLPDQNGLDFSFEMYADEKPDSYCLAPARKSVSGAEAEAMLKAHLDARGAN